MSYELINKLAVMNHVEVDVDPELGLMLDACRDSASCSPDIVSSGNGADLDTIPENEEYTCLDMGHKPVHGQTRFRYDTVMVEMSLKHLAVFAGKFSHRFNFCISRGKNNKLQFYIAGIKEDEEQDEEKDKDENEDLEDENEDEDEFDDANEEEEEDVATETQSKHTHINLDDYVNSCRNSPLNAKTSNCDNDDNDDALLPSFYSSDDTPQPSDVESLHGNLYGDYDDDDDDDDDCGTEGGCTVSNTITHSNRTYCDENDYNNGSQLQLTATRTLDDGSLQTEVITEPVKDPVQEVRPIVVSLQN